MNPHYLWALLAVTLLSGCSHDDLSDVKDYVRKVESRSAKPIAKATLILEF